MQLSPSGFESFFLSSMLWGSLGLLLLSLVWLVVIALRRIGSDQRKARDADRAARVRSFLYAAIKSPVMPELETLPKVTQSDYPAIMGAALDILRNIRGADSARVIDVLRLGNLEAFLRRTARSGLRGQRIQAISLLGYVETPENIDCLVACADDRNIYVQMAALRALARFRGKDRVNEVVEVLRKTRSGSSILLTEILSRFGPDAVPALLRLAARESATQVRVAAVKAVGLIGERSSAAAVANLFGDETSAVRTAAVEALARLGDIRFSDLFLERMTDPDPAVRAAAIQAVGKLNLRQALAPLSRALDESAWQVRFLAAEALVELGAPGRAILRARERGAPGVGSQIAHQMLGQTGEAA